MYEVSCSDEGSNPSRSTLGGSRGLVADYEMRNIPEVVIVMHTFSYTGPVLDLDGSGSKYIKRFDIKIKRQ